MHVHILLHDCSSVGNPWRVIVFPDVLDLVGGFAFDHGHFHDLSELAGTGVSEGKGIGCSVQKHLIVFIMMGDYK